MNSLQIRAATPADLEPALSCLTAAFAHDPITGYLLQTGPGYVERLGAFFSLLMRGRLALGMPVLVACSDAGVHGAAMGYSPAPPAWPPSEADAWDRFEQGIEGLTARMTVYDTLAEQFKPTVPHHYLGVLGLDPALHGRGIGAQLLGAFCARSTADPHSHGVYLETANPSNVAFYERAGFSVTGSGRLGAATLWCMFRPN